MFPISDATPKKTFPFVNYALIAINVVVFIIQSLSPSPENFIYQFAFIPSEFNAVNPFSYIYIFTSTFIHGDIFHILTNMWFLHIFGDNIEDTFGHFRYLLFYLVGGLVAAMAQYVFLIGADVPMIGASGAVSAVAGAYFIYFRHSHIKALITLIYFWTVRELPA